VGIAGAVFDGQREEAMNGFEDGHWECSRLNIFLLNTHNLIRVLDINRSLTLLTIFFWNPV
jgi:hypothetical protein